VPNATERREDAALVEGQTRVVTAVARARSAAPSSAPSSTGSSPARPRSRRRRSPRPSPASSRRHEAGPAPARRSSGASGESSGGAAPSGGFAALAQCESGGNPGAVSSTGKYRGLYQFSVETWRSVGGAGDPAAASAAEQTRRAQMLLARSGAGQWPECGRYLR
jgi:hypothetical protein